MIRLLALALAATPMTLRAEPRMGLPIACTLGTDCFVLNYMDGAPGPDAEDFTCGPLSYDGHTGTDIAVASFAAMRAGVAVLAAAPGVVRATRDGMPDLGLEATPPEVLDGRDCGNGVLIDHGDGWETQYCHLREGSVAVHEGGRVARGTAIGQVGFSGATEFPHVHFEVRASGDAIDPFDADGARVCGEDDGPGDDLWLDPPGYRAGGVVAAGIFPEVPAYDVVKDGSAHRASLPGDAPALVGWVLVHGARPGDVVEITLVAPDGTVFDRHRDRLEKAQVMAMRAAGRKRPEGGWLAGAWQVRAKMVRSDVVLGSAAASTRVAP